MTAVFQAPYPVNLDLAGRRVQNVLDLQPQEGGDLGALVAAANYVFEEHLGHGILDGVVVERPKQKVAGFIGVE